MVEQSDEESVKVMAITNEKKETAEWIVDSAYIAHLYSYVDWFSSYKPMEGKA